MLTSAGVASIVAAAPLYAQVTSQSGQAESTADSSKGGLQDIVVTAQRRAENTQKVPIAIDTVSGEALMKRNIVDPTQLTQLVPSAQIGQSAGAYPVFFLRGGGSFSTNSFNDSAVVVSLDGVPMARQYNINGQFFDLTRVEVLEGPQGTLYGRNATGGAINLIPQRPGHTFRFDGVLSVGNYGAVITHAAADVPLNSALAARLSFHSSNHKGYTSDGLSDDDTQAGRVQLAYDGGGPVTALLSGDIVHQGGKGAGFVLVDHGYEADQRVGLTDPRAIPVYTSLGLAPIPAGSLTQNNRYEGTKLEVNWKSDLGTLTVLPAYRHADVSFKSAYGGGENDNETDNQESVEVRFASNDRGALRWIVGGFYLRDQAKACHVNRLPQQFGRLGSLQFDHRLESGLC
ncbi:TonB-dependent receptor [Sphingomonas sp. GC_Shp_2]|uniref:TonB-dependent receptor n=1 Tax=Sphingomonas sp. GC_Shp_2 TaxID=2937384 RepID=UPI00226A750F|nr:TonB-dependent receptor [Sphingomonas sp. GC_Shp_2]